MAARISVVAGAVGFFAGVWYNKVQTPSSFEVFAGNALLPTPAEPMDISVSGDYLNKVQEFGLTNPDTLSFRKSFILSYDRRNRVPNWVFEHLTKDHIKHNENINRSKSEFFEDLSIHPYFRSTNSDYKRSGFDRGHLAAAGNHRCRQDFLDDTFVLSNITPQVGKGFNRDAWNNLEKHVRHQVKKYQNVYVCSGPLYLPRMETDGKKYVKYQVIGKNNVAVPTHFFKVVVYETENREFDMETYVMPNTVIDENVPLKSFLVPKDVIERNAGFLVFQNIPSTVFRTINGHKAHRA
ncbi:endonuclease G, mitochondrial [Parasteatoda tepidariorum]|uniref:endonuclease G, mitochondrial n=1 Tax=Parasteatoda tepidariorum TaxID=114398 RepID=UPI00077FB930|nr:endonuclease G, mitochondrial [Parasteatoda tepidariorum]